MHRGRTRASGNPNGGDVLSKRLRRVEEVFDARLTRNENELKIR